MLLLLVAAAFYPITATAQPMSGTVVGHLYDGTQIINVTVPSDPSFTPTTIVVPPDYTHMEDHSPIIRPSLPPIITTPIEPAPIFPRQQ